MNKLDLGLLERLMVIAWKWRNPKSKDPLVSSRLGDEGLWAVDGDDRAGILRMDPAVVEEGAYNKVVAPYTIDKSVEELQEFLLKHVSPGQRMQIYLHTSQGYRVDDCDKLRRFLQENGYEHFQVNSFHHFDSALYISPQSPLGLLATQDGNWGETMSGAQYFYAKKSDRTIAREHFDFVWHTYETLPRKKTYEIAQTLTRTILPAMLPGGAGKKLTDYPVQLEALKKAIENYQEEFSKQESFADLCQNLENLKWLFDHVEATMLTEAALVTRRKANELLNQLPGHHIYA